MFSRYYENTVSSIDTQWVHDGSLLKDGLNPIYRGSSSEKMFSMLTGNSNNNILLLSIITWSVKVFYKVWKKQIPKQ